MIVPYVLRPMNLSFEIVRGTQWKTEIARFLFGQVRLLRQRVGLLFRIKLFVSGIFFIF